MNKELPLVDLGIRPGWLERMLTMEPGADPELIANTYLLYHQGVLEKLSYDQRLWGESPWYRHLHFLRLANLGVDLGLAPRIQTFIDETVSDLLAQPNPEEYVDLFRWWSESRFATLVDGEALKERWRDGIAFTKDLVCRSYQLGSYCLTLYQQGDIKRVMPEVARLDRMAAKLLSKLPEFADFHLVYPLSNLSAGQHPAAIDIYTAIGFMSAIRQLGLKGQGTSALHAYFDQVLEYISISDTNPSTIANLLQYQRSTASPAKLRRIATKCLEETHDADVITEMAALCYLQANDFSQALATWHQIQVQSQVTLLALITHGHRNGRLKEIRKLSLVRMLNPRSSAHHVARLDWLTTWLRAAASLAEEGDFSLFEEPEVQQGLCLSNIGALTRETLIEAIVKYPRQSWHCRQLVVQRLQNIIHAYDLQLRLPAIWNKVYRDSPDINTIGKIYGLDWGDALSLTETCLQLSMANRH